MHLVAVAWIYVASLMALAEATSPTGTVLGALFTFLLYGLGPVALLLYLLATPARRRLRSTVEAAMTAEPVKAASRHDSRAQPDGSSHAAGDPITAKREEP